MAPRSRTASSPASRAPFSVESRTELSAHGLDDTRTRCASTGSLSADEASSCASGSSSTASSGSSARSSLCHCADKGLWTPALEGAAVRSPGPSDDSASDRAPSPTLMPTAFAADVETGSEVSESPLPSPPLSSFGPSSGTLTPMAARPPFETTTSYSPRCEPVRAAQPVPDDARSARSARSNASVGSAIYAPTSPPSMPFLPTSCDPPGCSVEVDDRDPTQYSISITLPGFQIDNVLVALKRHGSLHVIADRYADPPRSPLKRSGRPSTAPAHSSSFTAAHFERMITLLNVDRTAGTQAAWRSSDSTLTVRVPRKTAAEMRRASTTSSRSMSGASSFHLPIDTLAAVEQAVRRSASTELRAAALTS